uniref:Uncharacterized protein n=1 Tax=Meloidogyne javanica TaxID=6303 RepID=A0A915N6K7_MELJA
MAADMEEAVELLQEELDANYSDERDNFVSRKGKQEDKALDNYTRAWENPRKPKLIRGKSRGEKIRPKRNDDRGKERGC